MDVDKDQHFCKSCGSPMRKSESFCSRCGATRKTWPASSQNNQRYSSTPQKSNSLMWISILSFLWAVSAIALGFYYILAADAIAQEAIIALENMGYDVNFDLTAVAIVLGALMLSSGILAAVSGAFSFIKRFYIAALVTCIISAALAMIFLVGLFGLIVAFFITKSKDEFINVNAP